ncbi:MAG: hypothetical protein JST39_23230 [Bacteroidetes bacterium]|nr:hypothetical protein [Bacteroidota bacterium]
MKKRNRQPAIEMDIVVEGNPLQVVAKPYYSANDEPRFRVSYNGSPVHIFGEDHSLHQLVALDSGTEQIPAVIERAIGNALHRRMTA